MEIKKNIKMAILVVLVSIMLMLVFIPTYSARSFNQPIQEGLPTESRHPAVDAIGDDVFCSYSKWDNQNNPNTWGIYLSTSANTGRNWAQVGWVDGRVHPPNSTNNTQDYSDVFIQVISGRVHIVWQEYNSTEWRIMYRYYDPAVPSWGPIQTLSNNVGSGRNATHPKVACDGYNEQNQIYVHVVWQEVQPITGVWEVMYRDSWDDGLTWPILFLMMISGADGTQSTLPVIEPEFRS